MFVRFKTLNNGEKKFNKVITNHKFLTKNQFNLIIMNLNVYSMESLIWNGL